jgi:beta-fructofuranosidase
MKNRLLLVFLLAIAGMVAYANAAQSPLRSADLLLQMTDLGESAHRGRTFQAHGKVRAGIPLGDPQRAESITRGGDGQTAEFDGGWLSSAANGNPVPKPAGKSMTLCLRLRDPSGKWNAPIVTQRAAGGKLVYALFARNLPGGMSLGFDLGVDGNDRPLQVSCPLSLLGATDWHDVVVRYRGAKLDMFVDGVLVDENWPLGSLRPCGTEPLIVGEETHGTAPGGFHGQIDHFALWNRALSDDEITALCGGCEVAARRQKQILGEPQPSLQYWKPLGYNTNVGDCMPFYHDGTFHLFYLFDRRHHGSKYGMGAHQWAHASSRDLVHWTHHPMAIPITDEFEASICTGSVMFHAGKYYAYYATRMADRSGERLSLAVSTDGIHFTKTKPNPFAAPPSGYGSRDYRDPKAFRDEQTGRFHLLVTARLADARGGCLAHLESSDLKSWAVADPFLVTGFVPECADHFLWNGWYYLMSTRYWMSRKPLGPWTPSAASSLDVLYVPKTAEFTGNRRLYVSWLPEGGWGGCAVFREVVQHADGTLGTKFPVEMIPETGSPARLSVVSASPGAKAVNRTFTLPAAASPEKVVLGGLPADARIRCRIMPGAGQGAFGLRMRSAAGSAQANELRFLPQRRRLEIVKGPALEAVAGLDRELTLDIIVKDNILDVCLNNDHTLVGRCARLRGDQLELFAEQREATFSDLDVRPLK